MSIDRKSSIPLRSIDRVFRFDRSRAQILNYQEEVCLWNSVATHAEKEQSGLSIGWPMNVALSSSSVVDVFSIINWLTISVSLLSTTSAKKPLRIWVSIKFDKA
ncbi:hypothetical protein F2Q68_00008577 [Brassica cretica]|uniref:Uncharacterized protein n=1 Tax=Brassica cretica TaxID=69181 RepID=A0A8S9KZS6_BRACR|nr:hypothetical protein F2Q68_00008577 [Brassica cretica]